MGKITTDCQSKALSTVPEGKCSKTLKEHLNKDELRIVRYHIVSAKTCVKIENPCGYTLKANVGISQGDSLLQLLFVVYLFKATKKLGEKLTFNNIDETTYAGDKEFYSGLMAP